MNDIQVVLTEQLASPAIADALPKEFNKFRFVQNCLTLINDSPDLKKYTQAQIVSGLLKGAYLGLDFYNKECYLIPYGQILKFSIDYKGLKKLVMKYSVVPVKDIGAWIVREGDEYESGLNGNEPYVNLRPKPFNDGKILGAVAICFYKDGSIKYEEMSKAQLDAAKRLSQAQTGTAWKFFDSEMYKKTALRRLCKNITLDFENLNQMTLFKEDGETINDNHETVIVEEENPFT